MQIDYYSYHINDFQNYQTGQLIGPTLGVARRPDFDALEIKRMRLIFEGNAFGPDLRYRIQINGDTRGLSGMYSNNDIVNNSPVGGGTSAIGGGTVTIDNTVRLFEGWIAYDFHPGKCKDNCPDSPNCPNGMYRPTITLMAGKMKPWDGLEEYLGSGTDEYIEYSMADWFFSTDQDNLQMAAGVQVKALEDRFYGMALLTNGSEWNNFAASQLDDLPGACVGGWYDFGGNWDEGKKAWQLFGDCVGDIDYSKNAVVRTGGSATYAAMDHRTLYGDAEEAMFRGAVGGARIIDILNGDTLSATTSINAAHAVDKFDATTLNWFTAAKWRGWSIDNEWWLRVLNDFSAPVGGTPIVYTARTGAGGAAQPAIFNVNNLVDWGVVFQGGYFVIPTKLEVVARWSMVSGESGSINGNGTTTAGPVINGVATRIVNDAFRVYNQANEYTMGVNYFFKRHMWKWQTDVGYYHGGTPASASAAGFITNADGWLARTQIQMAF